MNEQLCWIQLSDLHIFDSTEWNIMQQEYKRVLKKKKIDFVIVTGDLHQFDDDYKKTLTFLNNMIRYLEIKPKDVFIIPGNHDVESFRHKDLVVKYICENITKDIDCYYEYYSDFIQSYTSYVKFLKDFYGEDYKEYEKVINGHNLFTWNDKINILALNSTFICDGDNKHQQILNTRDLSTLSIKNGLPTIACSHHYIDDIYQAHCTVLSKVLATQKVSAFLCGDRHLYSASVLRNNISVECIVCGKSVCEPKDDYSQIGFILYESTKDNRCVCHPFLWEGKNNYRFEPFHGFDDENGNPKNFILRTDPQSHDNDQVINSENNSLSIWLPDAELATGKQTRFETFTETNCVNTFLDADSTYWGIASVKGIGKTFLLQVKRVQMASNSICFPHFSKPSKDNNWATEAVKFNNPQIFKNNYSQEQLTLLWRFAIICYVEHCWLNMQDNLTQRRRSRNYYSIIQWINEQCEKENDINIIKQYLLNNSYSKLTLIVNDILSMTDWVNILSTHYSFLHKLGIRILDSISRNKKKTIALFLDKLDQSIRQPNSEEALDCSVCSKSQVLDLCKNDKKNTSFCFGTDNNSCPQRTQCCYGCENYSNEFAGSEMRIYNNSEKADLRHVNYWQRLQLALIEAVNQIKEDFDGRIKIIYTVRLEAYNCEADVLGSNRSKILSLTETLKYSRDDHEKIYKECIRNQNTGLLFSEEKLKNVGHEDEAFVGVNGICHPYVNGEIESIFDIIYRHSFDRTRDIQYYGQAITNALPRIRKAESADERSSIVKNIIEETAAQLAYNTDRSTVSTEYSYYFEKIPNMPSYWSDAANFEKFITLIDRNLLFKNDICNICKIINNQDKCNNHCQECIHHPFSMLFNLGMLGYVSINETGIDKVEQHFLDAHKITYFHEQNVLPINFHTLYIIHPALTKSIEALKKDKIMHFSGFLLGKGIEVSQIKIRNILEDKNNLTMEQFDNKYYKIIRD